MTGKEIIDQYNADMAALRAQMADPNVVKNDAFFADYNEQLKQLNADFDAAIKNASWS